MPLPHCRQRGNPARPELHPWCDQPEGHPRHARHYDLQDRYTKSIRPPESITKIEKRENAAAYGYTGSLKDVEYHLVPLEVGGDPNDPRNLWVDPGASPNRKDDVELELHDLVCRGTVLLTVAQQAIATDWTTAINVVTGN
jgi:hypothetical protein